MSKAEEKGVGCGGAIVIILALAILLGLGGMGSDKDAWCPPDHWACQPEE